MEMIPRKDMLLDKHRELVVDHVIPDGLHKKQRLPVPAGMVFPKRVLTQIRWIANPASLYRRDVGCQCRLKNKSGIETPTIIHRVIACILGHCDIDRKSTRLNSSHVK